VVCDEAVNTPTTIAAKGAVNHGRMATKHITKESIRMPA
jgi:hypothetical protein